MRILCTAALAAAAIFIPTDAQSKQCIWNKGAYVLKVEWYRPASLSATPNPGPVQRKHAGPIVEFSTQGSPVKTDVFPTAQGRCNETNEELTAVVHIVGTMFPEGWYAPNTLHKAGKLDCQAARCPARINAREVYLLITPPTDRYIDFWGGTLDPEHGPGGKI